MRVLALCNLYPPHALGGYEMSCADVMTRFAEAGHEVHVLTTDTRLPGVGGGTALPVTRELRWYWDDHRIVDPGWVGSWRLDRANRRLLDQVIAAVAPQVVSVWAMGGLSMSLLDRLGDHRLPSVWMVCDEWPVYGPRMDAWRARRGGLAPSPRTATICWVSDWLRRRVTERTGWRPAREVVTGSGVDEREFPPYPAGERPWRWRLLAVGRVEPRKGFATAVAALARLPRNATLRIAGSDDGSHADQLRRDAADCGVADRLTIEPVPRSRLAAVYADADAVLFPSNWQEPFGLVPLEAMRCATPVVAVPSGGSAEFLRDGVNCLAVPPNDADAMAAACLRLADDPGLRARLVAGGLDTAAARTVASLAGRLEQEHLRAAGGEHPR